jgi:hypothetical protein
MIEFSISWCVRLPPALYLKDGWLCRIILEKESQINAPTRSTGKQNMSYFPSYGGGHSISIKHAGLPPQIQYFYTFCILIKKPAHTSDCCQWAPGQGTGTQSYPQFESCHSGWWTSLEPSLRWNLKVASSVSTALTESNCPSSSFKSRAVRWAIVRCLSRSWRARGRHGRRRGRSGTGASNLSSRAR